MCGLQRGRAGRGRAGRGVAQPTASTGKPSVLVRNLEVPWAIAFLPDGDALVTERDSARLLRVTPQGRVSTVGTVPGVEPSGEGGLLGVAVSPSFGRDRLVYLYFSTAADNRIARFRYPGGGIGPTDGARCRAHRDSARRHSQRRTAGLRTRRHAVGDHRRARRTRYLPGPGFPGRQDPPDDAGRQARSGQPVRHAGVDLRAPQRAGDRVGQRRADVRLRARPEPLQRSQPDPEGAQLRLARYRGSRPRPGIHRSRAYLDDRGGIAVRRRDSGRQPLGRRAARDAAVAGPAGPHGRGRQAGGALHRRVRPAA